MKTHDAVFHPDFDFGDFRYAVARYVKLLIRSRWKVDPGFLTQDELAEWNLEDISKDPWTGSKLLEQAASALGLLNREFLPRCGSGGLREVDETSAVGRLIISVTCLVPSEGGGPEHNEAIIQAGVSIGNNIQVDWSALVAWESLGSIRNDLDLLPHPQRNIDQSDQYLGLTDTLGRLVDVLSKATNSAECQSPHAESLSKKDAAKFIGVTVAALEHLIRNRKISYVQLGSQRGRVIPVEALRQFLAKNTQLTGDEELRRRARR